MSNVLIQNDTMSSIGEAIRTKTGGVEKILPSEMPDEILKIQTGGSGDVTGPGSATDGNVAVFSGATGKVIKDSGKTLGVSVPDTAVFLTQAEKTRLTAMDGHTHSNMTELNKVKDGDVAKWNGAAEAASEAAETVKSLTDTVQATVSVDPNVIYKMGQLSYYMAEDFEMSKPIVHITYGADVTHVAISPDDINSAGGSSIMGYSKTPRQLSITTVLSADEWICYDTTNGKVEFARGGTQPQPDWVPFMFLAYQTKTTGFMPTVEHAYNPSELETRVGKVEEAAKAVNPYWKPNVTWDWYLSSITYTNTPTTKLQLLYSTFAYYADIPAWGRTGTYTGIRHEEHSLTFFANEVETALADCPNWSSERITGGLTLSSDTTGAYLCVYIEYDQSAGTFSSVKAVQRSHPWGDLPYGGKTDNIIVYPIISINPSSADRACVNICGTIYPFNMLAAPQD